MTPRQLYVCSCCGARCPREMLFPHPAHGFICPGCAYYAHEAERQSNVIPFRRKPTAAAPATPPEDTAA